ncbi:MAG: hypothetical protein KKA61_03500 [Nanoarchaeota archaeon]|nr:hypothetical protein [Nanoarchaeota archaeon]MBU4493412.1 hypothetical protein [Nanoarchaeota archaeon]
MRDFRKKIKERVICPHCKKGNMLPYLDPHAKTEVFMCEKCGFISEKKE